MALQGFDIHWHDGLFVLQHHLQVLQRSMNARDAGNRSLAMRHPWGVLEIVHQEDALSEGMISFSKLKVIMPSGQFVDVPYSADLEPLRVSDAIKTAPSGVRVMLAVPNWTPTGANMADEESVDGAGRWNVEPVEARDENDGSDPEQILVRRLNARLVLEDNVPAGMEVLPLVRVLSNQQSDNFSIGLDASYAPPSIFCKASSAITSLVGELAARLAMAREEHLAFLARGGYEVDRLIGQQVEWMLRLQAISSILPRLTDSVWVSGASPFDLYHELRQLLGQLSPLRPTRDLYEITEYNHLDPLPALAELQLRIRNLVFDAGLGSFMTINFVSTQSGGSDIRMDAKLEDKHFVKGKGFYLAVDSDDVGDTSGIVEFVLNSNGFKLLPTSQANSRIRGLKLIEDRFPPLSLPAKPGRVFFRIDESENSASWSTVRQERQVSAVWSSSARSSLSMTMFVNTTEDTDG